MGRYQHPLLNKETGVYSYDELVVLRTTRMPAVLLEAGSIINRDEELKMDSPERQDIISGGCRGGREGILRSSWASSVRPDGAVTTPPRIPSRILALMPATFIERKPVPSADERHLACSSVPALS